MDKKTKGLIDTLEKENKLQKEEYIYILENYDDETLSYIGEKAVKMSKKYFSNKIYTRGLIEISNICKNDCYYCGIRKSNSTLSRYRLSKEDILFCCREGYSLGFRTFVLQGGEDGHFTDDFLCDIIKEIKNLYPDCAVTLSLGERNYESYKKLKNAGADRYLLRHETANDAHYSKLHPAEMKLSDRKKCLFELKELGYQTGAGFMVGSPYQNNENIAEDLLFIKELNPQMVGIGPFIPHKDTPFAGFSQGNLKLTLLLLSIIRLMLKNVLLPATTALGTICKNGRELGILAGANVVMPNLSPVSVRKKYSLYDNKICTGEEAAENLVLLEKRFNKIGYTLSSDRGDYIEEDSSL